MNIDNPLFAAGLQIAGGTLPLSLPKPPHQLTEVGQALMILIRERDELRTKLQALEALHQEKEATWKTLETSLSGENELLIEALAAQSEALDEAQAAQAKLHLMASPDATTAQRREIAEAMLLALDATASAGPCDYQALSIARHAWLDWRDEDV